MPRKFLRVRAVKGTRFSYNLILPNRSFYLRSIRIYNKTYTSLGYVFNLVATLKPKLQGVTPVVLNSFATISDIRQSFFFGECYGATENSVCVFI